jgi:hypothetical protein
LNRILQLFIYGYIEICLFLKLNPCIFVLRNRATIFNKPVQSTMVTTISNSVKTCKYDDLNLDQALSNLRFRCSEAVGSVIIIWYDLKPMQCYMIHKHNGFYPISVELANDLDKSYSEDRKAV